MMGRNRQDDRMTPGFNAPPTRVKRDYKAPRSKDAFGEEGWHRDPIVQQGTLFSHRAVMNLPGNKQLKREQVGPKGFSRNRLDEVRKGIAAARPELNFAVAEPSHWQTGDDDSDKGGDKKKMVSAVTSGQHIYAPDWKLDSSKRPGAYMQDRLGERGMAHLEQTLARSTAPVGDLKGLTEIKVTPKSETNLGQYNPDREGMRQRTGRISLRGRAEGSGLHDDARSNQEITFLHELGHHESWTAGSESSQYDTAAKQGVEEARADTYSMTHYRADPRSTERRYGEKFDPRQHTYGARGQEHYRGMTDYGLSPNLQQRQHSPERTAVEQRAMQPMLDEGQRQDQMFAQDEDRGVFHHEAVPLTMGKWDSDTEEKVPLIGGKEITVRRAARVPRPLKASYQDGDLPEVEKTGWREIAHRDQIYEHEAQKHNSRQQEFEDAQHSQEIEAQYGVGRKKPRQPPRY